MPKRGGMFRVSVGIEDLEDIRADVERGLAAVASAS
jgi:cystathionine beta-lyase/cystathionine gamma-synthase